MRKIRAGLTFSTQEVLQMQVGEELLHAQVDPSPFIDVAPLEIEQRLDVVVSCVHVCDARVPVLLVHRHSHLEDSCVGNAGLVEERAKLRDKIPRNSSGNGTRKTRDGQEI